VDLDVGEGGNDLGLWGQFCAFLELEVSDGSGQSEIAVNPAEIDEAACRCDPGFLGCKPGKGSGKSVKQIGKGFGTLGKPAEGNLTFECRLVVL
jgi:hypothetical protein